jgi:hypothetical protein
LYCFNPFVPHVTLRSMLPSLQQTTQTSMPPVGFFFLVPFFPFIHFVLLNPSVLHVPYYCPYTTTQHKHPCPRWDSKPRSQ